MLTALAIVGYGVVRRPELLRSERFTLLSRYFEVIGDSAMKPEVRDQMNSLLLTLGDETSKESVDDVDDTRTTSRENGDA